MDASFHIRPFGFDNVFDIRGTVSNEDNPDELRIRVAALSADLAVANHALEDRLAHARAEGFDAGLVQARKEQAAALLNATDAMHAAIEGVDGRLEDIADRMARDAAGVAHAAAELMAGHALVGMPAAAIDDAIGRVLREVARGQEIQVSVHPDLLSAVEAVIATRQAGDRRRLAISAKGDPALAYGDTHIDWDRGGVILDAAARAAAVREALVGVLDDAQP